MKFRRWIVIIAALMNALLGVDFEGIAQGGEPVRAQDVGILALSAGLMAANNRKDPGDGD
jgi:hypothetical protein